MAENNARGRSVTGLALIGAAVGIAGAAFFFALMPMIASDAAEAFPELSWLLWPGLAAVWAVAALCYLALYEYFRLVREIARDNTFSEGAARALRGICVFTAADGALMACGLVFLCAMKLCAPLIGVGFLVAIMFFAAVAVISRSLARMVLDAAELRRDSELTI